MSWFTDIAGKAEDFLNKIDKNAATALNTSTKNEKEPRSKKTEPFIEPTNENNSNRNFRVTSNAPVENGTTSVALTGSLENNTIGASSSSRKASNNKRQSRTTSNIKTSLNSVNETIASSNNSKLKESSHIPKTVALNQNGTTEKKSSKSAITLSSSVQKDAASEEDLIAYLNSTDDSGTINESLILKDEVENQARELKLLTKSCRSLQTDNEELKQKLAVYQTNLEIAETTRHSNEADERDLRKLVEKRDTEIRDLSSRHEQALSALQKLELSQDNLQKLEQCLLENTQLKSENESLQQRTEQLASQVETAENHVVSMKSTLSSMEKEFTNYKEKAKSILNYKDELIQSLKSDNSGVTSNGAEDTSSNAAEELLAEITALKNERELLQADISQTRAHVSSLKDDNLRLEKEVSNLRYFTEDLGGQFKLEKETVASLQSENLQVCQQLTSLQFELEREKNERKKNEELVTQYKQQATIRNNNSSPHIVNDRLATSNQSNGHVVGGVNPSDVEVSKLKTRVTALSQSLYEKQSLINDISTDKQLLQIEVERLRNDLRECRAESAEFCQSGLPQTVIASQPLYLSESPWDSRVSARMKRIYTQLDAVFCQFGLALRKRPNLRLGMSLYVIFLHLWVFFVLFSWMHHAAPEVA